MNLLSKKIYVKIYVRPFQEEKGSNPMTISFSQVGSKFLFAYYMYIITIVNENVLNKFFISHKYL